MNKKNKSFEVWVIIFLVIFSLLIFGIYLIYETYVESRSYVLFLKPYSIISCEKWECTNLSDKINEFNSRNYNTYFDGNFVGNNRVYYNTSNGKYYVFNFQNNNIYENQNLLAYSGKAKISQLGYVEEEVTDNDIYMISEESINPFTSKELLFAKKISLDFDGDNETEHLYFLKSNVTENLDSYFVILAYNDNNKISILEEEYVKTNIASYVPFVNGVIDIFDDGKLEFIYTKEFFSDIGYCNIIYRLKGNKFVKVNECEIVK